MRSNRGSLRHASAANRRSLSDASTGTCATPAAPGTADQYARACFQNACCIPAICCEAAMKSPIGSGLPGSAVLGMPRPKDCSTAWPPSSRLASSCAGSFGVLAMDGSSTLGWDAGARKQRRSVKLHVRLRAPGNRSRRSIERHLPETVQRQFMHLVERQVHHAREPALDPQLAAAETAHQITDDGVLAQRDQRTEVPIP